jgi:3-hydroxybutyryl-CoA dehydrogenase
MSYSVCVQFFDDSRSFPGQETPFQEQVSPGEADVLILAGSGAGLALEQLELPSPSAARSRSDGPPSPSGRGRAAVLVELGTECLGVYTGESRGREGSNVLGFARFRLGHLPPSSLVEIVKQPATEPAALAAAREVFETAGLQVAVCTDAVGRIVDRLVRPYFNTALQALDEGLATADDLDLTVRLGLGYPVGPIALLESSGLAAHCEISQALYQAYGEPSLLPARRAQVAKASHERRAP